MRTYFAWGKAIDERGLSAIRSIEKIREWCWLLEREDIADKFPDYDNESYGKGILRYVCQELELKGEG